MFGDVKLMGEMETKIEEMKCPQAMKVGSTLSQPATRKSFGVTEQSIEASGLYPIVFDTTWKSCVKNLRQWQMIKKTGIPRASKGNKKFKDRGRR